MAITSEVIKRLRDKTGAGMMDCKKALEATNGDMDAAIEFLRKKGASVAAKRADRSAKEGMIVTRVRADGKRGVAVEVNAETDFVGRSDDFVGFANAVAGVLEASAPATIDALLAAAAPSGKTVAQLQNDLLAKVGEKIEVRRFQVLDAPNGVLAAYTHLGAKIGVLVEFSGLPAAEATAGAGRDIAMQVAAMSPLVVSRTQLDQATLNQELEIYRTQARNEGKPEQIIDRIATGKLEKFFQEVVLTEQIFVKDQGKTIADVLKEAGARAGAPVTVTRFVRFHLGEETK
jgi:elongation factor Ts